jgi:hypothetical protein
MLSMKFDSSVHEVNTVCMELGATGAVGGGGSWEVWQSDTGSEVW